MGWGGRRTGIAREDAALDHLQLNRILGEEAYGALRALRVARRETKQGVEKKASAWQLPPVLASIPSRGRSVRCRNNNGALVGAAGTAGGGHGRGRGCTYNTHHVDTVAAPACAAKKRVHGEWWSYFLTSRKQIECCIRGVSVTHTRERACPLTALDPLGLPDT